jgi:hypothetical protein
MDRWSTLAEEFATLMVTPPIVFLRLVFDSIICFVNVLAAVAKLVQEFMLSTPEPAELEFYEFSGAVGKLFREFLFSNPTSAEMREWFLFWAFLSVPLSYILFRLEFHPCDLDVQEEAREEVGHLPPPPPPFQPRRRRQIMPRVPALSTDRLDVFYFARARHRAGGADSGRRAAAAAA